jgi:hypothetical protein
MTIPAFDANGLLPVGIHNCTLLEIEERFGRFQSSDRRCRLFERLRSFVSEASKSRLVRAIIIDGSFITDVDSPNDIDLILVLGPDHDYAAVLRPFEYNALSRRHARQAFGFDAVSVSEGTPALEEYVRFFSQVRDRADLSKGLLRVVL